MVAITVLGVALLASLPLLIVVVRDRLRIRRDPSMFRCKVMRLGRVPWHRTARWSRTRTHARWVHDVLLIRCGFLHLRTRALAVRLPEDRIRVVSRAEIRRLGQRPQLLQFQLDDYSRVEIAVAEDVRTLMVGPFLAAAIPGLPTTRVEHIRRRRR